MTPAEVQSLKQEFEGNKGIQSALSTLEGAMAVVIAADDYVDCYRDDAGGGAGRFMAFRGLRQSLAKFDEIYNKAEE